MRTLSYLDPSVTDFMIVELMLMSIENFVRQNKEEVEKEFKEWEKENKKSKKDNEEWYQWQEDRYVDEMFLVSELEINLLNGLAITVNTIFERHVSSFIREMSKQNSSIKYNDRRTYRMDELKVFLKKVNHPNREEIKNDLLDRLRVYTDVRNCIVHRGGGVLPKSVVRPFVLKNKDLFNKHHQLWEISVKGDYVRLVMKDLKTFFGLLAYTQNGDVIYY